MQEQLAIVRHITNGTTPLRLAINAADREIELLREYRTRLIADVVTGKLDVREAAARLPDEEDEREDERPEEGEMDGVGPDESEGGAHDEQ